MTLPIEGPLSARDINAELRREVTTLFNLNSKEARILGDKPTINTRIAYSDLRGKTYKQKFTIGTTQYNLNLRSYLLSQGWDGAAPVEVIIAANTLILAGSTTNYALTVDGEFPNGLRIYNYGWIVGRGGNGGAGGYAGAGGWRVCGAGGVGGAGGPGLLVKTTCWIKNLSVIAGGGGGGGGGAAAYGEQGSGYTESGGGGGGGGYPNGAAGQPTGGYGNSSNHRWGAGYAGTAGPNAQAQHLQGGKGGGGWNYNSNAGGTGGTGGRLGQNGFNGGAGPNTWVEDYATGVGGTGGSAGAAVTGNAFITWDLTAENYILGAVIN